MRSFFLSFSCYSVWKSQVFESSTSQCHRRMFIYPTSCLRSRHIIHNLAHELYIGINPHFQLIIPACLAKNKWQVRLFLVLNVNMCCCLKNSICQTLVQRKLSKHKTVEQIRGLQMTLACVLPCICCLLFTLSLLLTRKLEVN